MVHDIGIELYADPSWEQAPPAWFQVYPLGLRRALNFVKERYNNPVVLITENGYSSGPGRNDNKRVQYIRSHLNQVLDAIYEDGCAITHYTAWSLMDSFEWCDGYTSHFGLYEVDFEHPQKTRRPKKSAMVYKEIIKTRTIDPEYEPESNLFNSGRY